MLRKSIRRIQNLKSRKYFSSTGPTYQESWLSTEENVPKKLLEEKYEPLSTRIKKFNTKYPKRRLNFLDEKSTTDNESSLQRYHKVYSYGTERYKRVGLQDIKKILFMPLGLFGLFSFMNYDLYDIPSKLALIGGTIGSGYYYNILKNLRSMEARQVLISKEYKEFVVVLTRSEANKGIFEEELEEDLRDVLKDVDFSKEGVVRFGIEDVLYFGHSRVLNKIHEGHSLASSLKSMERRVGRDQKWKSKSPLYGTVMEMYGGWKEPTGVVFFSEKKGDFVRIDVVHNVAENPEMEDYLMNLSNGATTKFF